MISVILKRLISICDLPMRDLALAVWRPLVASLIMLGVLLGLKFFLPTNLASGWILGILIPTGILAYAIASWFINREQIQQFLGMLGVKI